MTPTQIELIQQSWRRAEPIAETVVRLFYRRLFEGTPDLRERFLTSMSEQSDHLLAATREMVEKLAANESLIGLVGAVDAFEERESALVEAWLWAIQHEIGRLATDPVCEAWAEAIRGEAGAEFKLVALGEVALING